MHSVGSAALSKLQATPHLLKEKYFAALSALAFFIMPAAAMLSVLSMDMVPILLGQKWRVAGSLLSIIALRGLFQVIDGSQGWLHLSTGRPDRWMKWGIITTIVQVVAIIVGLPFGARGVAIGFVTSGCVIAFPSILYAGRPCGIRLGEIVRSVGRQLAGAVITAGIAWWLRVQVLEGVSSLYRIIALTLVGVAIYLGIVVVLFRLTEPLRLGLRLVWEYLPARLAVKARALGG
jgi:O-antigen/teichoic acid export membrane protein